MGRTTKRAVVVSQDKEDISELCTKKMRKRLWSPDEDERLYGHIMQYGVGTWSSVAELAGAGRWMNYLQPDLSREPISKQEEDRIVSFQKLLGNRWSAIAARMPGRTDNEIKNYWNSHIKKKLQRMNTSNYQSLEVHHTEEGADVHTDGKMLQDLYRRLAKSEDQVDPSTTTSHNYPANHPNPNATVQNGDQAAHSSLGIPSSKSYEINYVEEYVEYLMSLSDDLLEI